MIKSYETVIIFTPILSDQSVKAGIGKYVSFLKENGAEIVQEDRWGLKQLAYPIQKKTTGIYFVMEFKAEGTVIEELEVLLKRDIEILRFLTVRLDKYAIKYNDDRRKGLIGRKKTTDKTENAEATNDSETKQEGVS